MLQHVQSVKKIRESSFSNQSSNTNLAVNECMVTELRIIRLAMQGQFAEGTGRYMYTDGSIWNSTSMK